MQTFLPYPDFRQSAAALDTPRLGKQRVEALQTLRALVIPEYGWQSHPAIRMWMGHVPALTMYGLAMVDEWTKRGFADNTRDNIREFAPQAAHPDYAAKILLPPWLGDPELHLSHRSNLIRKDPRFYEEVFPGTEHGPGVRLAGAPARVPAGGSRGRGSLDPSRARRPRRPRAAGQGWAACRGAGGFRCWRRFGLR